MKTKDLPASENVEDRRGDPSGLPTETLAEQAEQRAAFKRDAAKVAPDSKLAEDAGVNDIGKAD